jgi:Molydopterin dinucleotide binding domain
VTSAVGDENGPVAGRDPDEIIAALGERRGPERLIDLLLRLGPYGDGFGASPGSESTGSADGRRPPGVVGGGRAGLTLDLLLDHPHGIDLGPLEPRLPEVLRTPSGMIELAPELLVADVDRLRAALAGSRRHNGQGNGSLLLVGRRQLRSNNSWMHNVEVLVKGKARCTLQVHPDDADRLALVDGEPAEVRSRTGAVTIPVEVTDAIRVGVVSIPHGWGHDLEGVEMSVARRHAGVNSNLLADEQLIDPICGNAILNGIPVQVSPQVPADEPVAAEVPGVVG